jgi:hypothetical protein
MVVARLIAVLAVCSVVPLRASAQTPDASKQKAAETLFADARALIAAKKYGEAAAKLEQSHALDPALGTLLNLADCYEKLGRTASAWKHFRDAAAWAQRNKEPDRVKVADERAAKLERRLTRLAIEVPADARSISGLQVTRDGQTVPTAEWGTGVPVDPGEHVVAATAPGRRKWMRAVRVAGDAKTTTVNVEVPPRREKPDELLLAPTVSVQDATPAPVERPADTGRPTWLPPTPSLIAGGAGLLAIGVGGVFGLRARSQWSDAEDHCDPDLLCDDRGVELADKASTSANIATISFVLGAAALAGGGVYWWIDGRRARHSDEVTVAPVATSDSVGLAVGGAF